MWRRTVFKRWVQLGSAPSNEELNSHFLMKLSGTFEGCLLVCYYFNEVPASCDMTFCVSIVSSWLVLCNIEPRANTETKKIITHIKFHFPFNWALKPWISRGIWIMLWENDQLLWFELLFWLYKIEEMKMFLKYVLVRMNLL